MDLLSVKYNNTSFVCHLHYLLLAYKYLRYDFFCREAVRVQMHVFLSITVSAYTVAVFAFCHFRAKVMLHIG